MPIATGEDVVSSSGDAARRGWSKLWVLFTRASRSMADWFDVTVMMAVMVMPFVTFRAVPSAAAKRGKRRA
uniref:Uncharacterized protein n=1 Tax=Oryza punctata TaxID=4537 RepID=A0A0E0MHF5_ORYPU